MYQWEMLKAHQLKKPTEDLSLKETEVSEHSIMLIDSIILSMHVLAGAAGAKAIAKIFTAS